MKHQNRIHQWLRPALCGLALACTTSLIQAQTAEDAIISQFDDGGASLWSYNYGSTPGTIIEFDATQDRGPGAAPGSMKVTIPFDLCNGLTQCDFERVLATTLDLTKYTKLHFSVKVDPSSSHLSDWGAGAFGNMRPHVRLASWGGDLNLSSPDSQWIGTDAYGAWVDYAIAIDQTSGETTKSAAAILGIDIWSGWGTCAAPIGHTNTVTFWMDNIWFEYNTNTAPVPPPTTSIAKAGPVGVQISMDNNSDQWQRNGITTPESTGPYLWTGQGSYPVTYSCTITNFPDAAAHPGFEAHMYVVNGDTASADQLNGAVDWNAPDIFIFRVENGGAGAHAQIQWKTNAPSSNATNIPVIVDGPSVVGTWTVTFTDSTSGSLTGPGITATNFTLPSDAVLSNFSPASSYLQFGMFKNDGANDGHNNGSSGTYSRVSFNGSAAPFNDSFGGPSLTNTYIWRKTSTTAVQYIDPNTAWILAWTLPASGYTAQSAPSVTGPWGDAGATTTFTGAGKSFSFIPKTALPAGNTAYFRAIKRPFTQLQVLLPGESPAPNTVTGKTGTPTPVSLGAGGALDVTVRAVDTDWNLVSSANTIHISTDESSAFLPAGDVAMVNGIATFTANNSITFNAEGSWTVTATNMSKVMPAATSSPVTVGP